MAAVVLVRHAMPVVQPGVHPVRWRLDEFGRQTAAALAPLLPAGAAGAVWSSHEAKAAESATALAEASGRTVQLDPDLREVGRPAGWSASYADDAGGYLRAGGRPGWEAPAEVVRRVGAAVDRAAREDRGVPVLVTHGLAMALYVADQVGIPAASFWADLGYPDGWLLDADAGQLARLAEAS